MIARRPWTFSLDFPLGMVLLLAGAGLYVWAPAWTRSISAADALLWLGVIVLGTGLLLDLWRLLVVKVQPGDKETAMCVESVSGVGLVVAGLCCLAWPQWQAALPVGASVAWLGVSMVLAAWLHDLVFIRRDGRWQILREPEHGSFIIFGAAQLHARRQSKDS